MNGRITTEKVMPKMARPISVKAVPRRPGVRVAKIHKTEKRGE
jgi:hypothetical protein